MEPEQNQEMPEIEIIGNDDKVEVEEDGGEKEEE
jgi:hypothetical protein